MAIANIRISAPVAREVVEGRPLQQLQETALRTTSALNAFPLQPGALRDFVFDGVNPVTIEHGLGRIPRGWILVDAKVLNAYWRVSWDEGRITLMGFAADTARVWVF